MIARWEYEKRTAAQVLGLKVRSLVPLRNGWCRIPAGRVLTIVHKWDGYTLETDPCASCGVAVKVARVQPSMVDWVIQPYPEDCMCEAYPDLTALDCHVHWDRPDHFAEACAEPYRGEVHPCHCP